MNFDIKKFVSEKALRTMQKVGLHKLIGTMKGHDEMTLKQASFEIGQKAYVNRKEAETIQKGVEAFKKLK